MTALFFSASANACCIAIFHSRRSGLRECRRNYHPFLLHSRPKGSLCRTSARTAFCIFRAGMTSCFFAVCVCTCEGNEGLQREHLFAAGFPIGARSIPVGTRFCSAKSSVLYLCFRLTRERGWRRTLRCGRVWRQTLFRGSRTVGFCDVSYSTNAGFLRSKIRLAGKGSEGIYTPRPAAATLPVLMSSPSEAYPATVPPAALSGSCSAENVSPHRSACARYHL